MFRTKNDYKTLCEIFSRMLVFMIDYVQDLLPCLLNLTSGDLWLPLCSYDDVGVVNVHLVGWLRRQSPRGLFFAHSIPLHHPGYQLQND